MFIKVWAYASSNVGIGLYKRKMPNYVELQTWRNSPTVLSDCSHTSRIKQSLLYTQKNTDDMDSSSNPCHLRFLNI